MAIALSNSAAISLSGGGPQTGSFTNTSGNILWIFIVGAINVDSVTGVTYNGVAMTQVAALNAGADRYLYAYYLLAPATGSNTLSISTSGGMVLTAYGASYSGAKQSGQPDASGTNTATGVAAISKSITVVASNSWMVGAVFHSTSRTWTGQSGTTLLDLDAGTNHGTFHSNAGLAAGSQSLGVDMSGNITNGVIIVASFAPSLTTAGGAFLTNFI